MIDINTRDFGYFLGATLGDGYLYSRNNIGRSTRVIRLSVVDNDFAVAYSDAYFSLTGNRVGVRVYANPSCKNGMVYCVHIYNDYVVYDLLKRYKDDVGLISGLSDIAARGFVEGFFDAEGTACISKEGAYDTSGHSRVYTRGRIAFYNTNVSLIDALRVILGKFGIRCYVYRSGHLRDYGSSHSVCYSLRVATGSLCDFGKLFTSIIKRKSDKVTDVVSSGGVHGAKPVAIDISW